MSEGIAGLSNGPAGLALLGGVVLLGVGIVGGGATLLARLAGLSWKKAAMVGAGAVALDVAVVALRRPAATPTLGRIT